MFNNGGGIYIFLARSPDSKDEKQSTKLLRMLYFKKENQFLHYIFV